MPVSCPGTMTLGTLCVAVSAKKTMSFRTLQQQYGDGYLARRQDGLNPVNEKWDITTPAMPVSEAQALETELISVGASFFEWTAPNETVKKKWVLDPPNWSWEFPAPNLATLSFVLRRYYV